MLAWLCVWIMVQICIRLSWCHCHSLSLAPVNPDWFYLSAPRILVHNKWPYRGFPRKRLFNKCLNECHNNLLLGDLRETLNIFNNCSSMNQYNYILSATAIGTSTGGNYQWWEAEVEWYRAVPASGAGWHHSAMEVEISRLQTAHESSSISPHRIAPHVQMPAHHNGTRKNVNLNKALTLLSGWQERHPACRNWVVRYRHGYLSEAKCKWYAYGPADAIANHHLLLD